MAMQERLLFLNEDDVLSLLTPADAIAAAEDTFYRIGTGDITVGTMSMMFVDPEGRNNFHAMPAILHYRGVAGVKWIDTYADPLPGYPFSHGNLVLLSDTKTGSPIALVGAAISPLCVQPGDTASCRHGSWQIRSRRSSRFLAAEHRQTRGCAAFWRASPPCGSFGFSAGAADLWRRRKSNYPAG